MTTGLRRKDLPSLPMAPPAGRQPTAKICLIGDERVGKTSLIQRFVHGVYSPAYLRTIGAVVSKRSIPLPKEGDLPVTMNLMVWDVMGKKVFMDLLGEAYFAGAQAVLAVFDVTRPETLANLRPWVAGVRDIVGPVPAILLANKVDLVQERRVSADEIDPVAKEFGMAWYPASALTGENVEAAFRELAVLCRRNQLGSPSS